MKTKYWGAVATACLLLGPLTAGAVALVDTGAGTSTGGVVVANNDTIARQSVGGFITLSDAASISQVDGWMRVTTAGTLLVSIYSVSGSTGLPDVELFSSSIALAQATTPNWFGVSGLDWSLGAGNYWVVFGAPNNDPFYGSLRRDVPNPLAQYAFTNPASEWQYITSGSTTGYRVFGEYSTTSQVPEPGTLALFGLGLVGLGAVRRRRGG